MGLETGSYIQDLNASNPFSTDTVSEGDDHLRLIKKILKSQFPSLGAQSVTVSASAINQLSGIKSNIQVQLDALFSLSEADREIPSGANMLFYNEWSSSTFGGNWIFAELQDNYMVVVNNSESGTAAGNVDPTGFDHYHTTQGHRLTGGEAPARSEAVFESGNNRTGLRAYASNLTHTHGNTGSARTELRHGKFLLLSRI